MLAASLNLAESARNRTRVTSSQAIGRKMSVNGPPTSSQSKNLTSFRNDCCK